MWSIRRRQKRDLSLASEVEAYLDGSYAAYRKGLRQSVPSWAWLNRCAHASLATLRRLPREELTEDALARPDWSWARAERILVGELLSIVGESQEALGRVQQRILIPLELEYLDPEENAQLTAVGLVLSVRAALRSSLS